MENLHEISAGEGLPKQNSTLELSNMYSIENALGHSGATNINIPTAGPKSPNNQDKKKVK